MWVLWHAARVREQAREDQSFGQELARLAAKVEGCVDVGEDLRTAMQVLRRCASMREWGTRACGPRR